MAFSHGTSGWRWMDIAAGEVGTAYYPTNGKGGKTATAAESIASKSRIALGYISISAAATAANDADVTIKAGSTTFATITFTNGQTTGMWVHPQKSTVAIRAADPASTTWNEQLGVELPDMNITIEDVGTDSLALRIYYRIV